MSELLAAKLIRDVPDFPQPGIMFKDITPILEDPAATKQIISLMSEEALLKHADIIVGIESRGFVFGMPVAVQLGLGFVPVRKLGKLPANKITEEYSLEYGTNTVEIHTDSIKPGQRVVIVDDLLATGGTAAAAAKLVERLGGKVESFIFLIELSFLKGRDKLPGYDVFSMLSF